LAQTPVSLRVVGQVKAGSSFDGAVSAGQAVEIMTGAPVPAGADAVVMLEYTSPRPEANKDGPPSEIKVERSVAAGENVVASGSEARAGQLLLPRGTRLTPAALAMAAGAGQCRLNVFSRPRVAILSTGDELVEAGDKPRPDQIRNSNTYSLAA